MHGKAPAHRVRQIAGGFEAYGWKEGCSSLHGVVHASVATTLQLAAALDGNEPMELRKDRFVDSLDLLPDYVDDIDEEEWPALLQGALGVSPPIVTLVNKKTGFLFRNLPLVSRVLYVRCIGTSVAEVDDVWFLMKEGHADVQNILELPLLLEAAHVTPIGHDGGEDNLVRHFWRWNYLASLSIAGIRAMFSALTEASRQAPQDLSSLTGDNPLPWPAIGTALEPTSQLHLVRQHVNSFMEGRIFLSGTWVITTPGMITNDVLPDTQVGTTPAPGLSPVVRTAKSDRSEGLRFLQGQLTPAYSMYRMPKEGSPQKDWNAWFSRILELQVLFRDLPAKMIILMITGTVRPDDKRVFGWTEKSLEMAHNQIEPTLQQFVEHVQAQVMANAVTRREAYAELDRLVNDYKHVEDCQALATQLRQIWAQLYPPVTTEVEPTSKLNVLRKLHAFLQSIRVSTRGGRTNMMKAWCDYTTYDNAYMFNTYVDSVLHTSHEETDRLAKAFLEEACRQLLQAHRMSVQVGPNANNAVEYVNVVKTGSDEDKLQAAAALLDQPAHVVATWINTTGERKRPRPEDASSSGRGRSTSRGRGGGSGRGSASGRSNPPAAAGQNRTPPTVELETDYNVIFDRMRKMDCPGVKDDRVAGHLRGAFPGLSSMSYDAAVSAVVKDKACTLCFQTGHIGKKCPFRKGQTPALQERVKVYNNLLHVARRKKQE